MKNIKLSIKEFEKLMKNGSIGHHLNAHSVATYKSQIVGMFSRYKIFEYEYSSYTPEDLIAFFDLVAEEQTQNHSFSENTFKTLQSAQRCFFNYANLKYNGVVITGKKVTKYKKDLFMRQNQKCKSWLWRILNAFGLLKYV